MKSKPKNNQFVVHITQHAIHPFDFIKLNFKKAQFPVELRFDVVDNKIKPIEKLESFTQEQVAYFNSFANYKFSINANIY